MFLLTLCLVSIYSLPTRAGVFDQDEEYALTLWGWDNGIYYDSGTFNEVYVSNTTGNWSWATIWIDQEDNYPNLSGNITIPAEVYLGGPVFKQKVVGIRRNAFRNMRPAVSLLRLHQFETYLTLTETEKYSFFYFHGLYFVKVVEFAQCGLYRGQSL